MIYNIVVKVPNVNRNHPPRLENIDCLIALQTASIIWAWSPSATVSPSNVPTSRSKPSSPSISSSATPGPATGTLATVAAETANDGDHDEVALTTRNGTVNADLTLTDMYNVIEKLRAIDLSEMGVHFPGIRTCRELHPSIYWGNG